MTIPSPASSPERDWCSIPMPGTGFCSRRNTLHFPRRIVPDRAPQARSGSDVRGEERHFRAVRLTPRKSLCDLSVTSRRRKPQISHGQGRPSASSALPVAQAARVTAFPRCGQVFKGGEGRSVVPGQPGPGSSRFRRSPARRAGLSGAVAGSELVCGSPVAVLCCCTGVLDRGIGRSILWL
jgi:hypothetical protein